MANVRDPKMPEQAGRPWLVECKRCSGRGVVSVLGRMTKDGYVGTHDAACDGCHGAGVHRL